MRVAAIGAGIAGLACAWELHKAGVDVQVFEREDIVGGLSARSAPTVRAAIPVPMMTVSYRGFDS